MMDERIAISDDGVWYEQPKDVVAIIEVVAYVR
jgi:hypothetical protein